MLSHRLRFWHNLNISLLDIQLKSFSFSKPISSILIHGPWCIKAVHFRETWDELHGCAVVYGPHKPWSRWRNPTLKIDQKLLLDLSLSCDPHLNLEETLMDAFSGSVFFAGECTVPMKGSIMVPYFSWLPLILGLALFIQYRGKVFDLLCLQDISSKGAATPVDVTHFILSACRYCCAFDLGFR